MLNVLLVQWIRRFIVIVFPIRSRSVCTMSNCRRAVLVVWVISLLLTAPVLFTKVSFLWHKFWSPSVNKLLPSRQRRWSIDCDQDGKRDKGTHLYTVLIVGLVSRLFRLRSEGCHMLHLLSKGQLLPHQMNAVCVIMNDTPATRQGTMSEQLWSLLPYGLSLASVIWVNSDSQMAYTYIKKCKSNSSTIVRRTCRMIAVLPNTIAYIFLL